MREEWKRRAHVALLVSLCRLSACLGSRDQPLAYPRAWAGDDGPAGLQDKQLRCRPPSPQNWAGCSCPAAGLWAAACWPLAAALCCAAATGTRAAAGRELAATTLEHRARRRRWPCRRLAAPPSASLPDAAPGALLPARCNGTDSPAHLAPLAQRRRAPDLHLGPQRRTPRWLAKRRCWI